MAARNTTEGLLEGTHQVLTPEYVEFRSSLPYNETGKLLRRVLRAELTR